MTTECVFRIINNQLVAVSGADEGTYPIVDNKATIFISGNTHIIYPFKKPELKYVSDNTIICEVQDE